MRQQLGSIASATRKEALDHALQKVAALVTEEERIADGLAKMDALIHTIDKRLAHNYGNTFCSTAYGLLLVRVPFCLPL